MQTKAGVDRIKVQGMRASIGAVALGLHQHEQHCDTCRRAASDVYAKCATWWQLARVLHQTRRELQAYENAPDDRQQALPGMEHL